MFIALAIGLAILILAIRHPTTSFARHAFMVLTVATFAFWGALLFHSLLTGDPIGTGRVFYGALVGAALASGLVVRNFPVDTRFAYWNSAALICALCYGILRMGCFIDGCCWGSITALPWAVVYADAASVMPFKGVPVHPVQLYDSFAGFLIFALLYVYRSRFEGNAVLGFLILYPIARFITEFFRGDSERGVDLASGLSTSQVLSLAILASVLIFFTARVFTRLHTVREA